MKKLFLIGLLMIAIAVILLSQNEPVGMAITGDETENVEPPSDMIHWWWLLVAGILFLISFTIMFIFYNIRNKQVTGLGNNIEYMRTLIEKKDKIIREKNNFIEYQKAIILNYEEVIKKKNKALKTAKKTLEKIQKEKKK